MKNGKFEAGSIIKGRDLKGYMPCKIMPESMVICGFQYKLGMNGADIEGGCRQIKFYPAQDVCCHFSEGTKLALVNIPDDEDVYIWKEYFSAGRIVIEKVFQLNEVLASPEGWECLMLNGMDIRAGDCGSIRWAAKNGYLEVVKFLHGCGADITAHGNDAVKQAASNGHLEVVKYLYENGADITAGNNYAIRSAASNGHLETVGYLNENGADITACNNLAIRSAASNGHLEVVRYLHENGADITAASDYALEYAEKKGHMDVVKYLKENMR